MCHKSNVAKEEQIQSSGRVRAQGGAGGPQVRGLTRTALHPGRPSLGVMWVVIAGWSGGWAMGVLLHGSWGQGLGGSCQVSGSGVGWGGGSLEVSADSHPLKRRRRIRCRYAP